MFVDDMIKAIQGRHRLWLNYPPGRRLIEPHALGRSRKGDLLLRAYQVEGASASNEPVDWKLLRVDRFIDLSISEQTFAGTRPDYNPNDPAMKNGIIACI